MAGPEDAQSFFLSEIDGSIGSFQGAVFAESHGFQAVLQAIAGHLSGLRVQEGEAVFGRDPQMVSVQQQALDLAVHQAVLLRIERHVRLVGLEIVQPAETIPVGPRPKGVSVRGQRHAGGHPDQPGFQGLQVDDVQAVDAAHPQLVRSQAHPEARSRLSRIPGIGRLP